MKTKLLFPILGAVWLILPMLLVPIESPRQISPWVVEGNQDSASFGWSVNTAGDVNGDGYSDVIVGAHGYDHDQANEGRAYVFYGSADGLVSSSPWIAESNQAEARFGITVGSAGDVNNDGFDDVIIGSPVYDHDQDDEGAAFVYYGSAGGLNSDPDWSVESHLSGSRFGWSVSTAGDVNGDGFSDVIIGARWYYDDHPNEGKIYVYHGSSTGLSDGANWTVEGEINGAQLGWSVSTAGDVNGDGYDDVIVGSPPFGNTVPPAGRALLFYGSASGLSLTADRILESDQADARFGISVDSAGDVNGDGYDDVIVGADLYDNEQMDEGRAFVYLGSSAGVSQTAAWTAESDQDFSGFGFSVASAGDWDGDSYADVVVGAPNYDSNYTNQGRVYIYHGSVTGLSSVPCFTTHGDQAEESYGISTNTAGNVNGDEYADMILGADKYDGGEIDEGAAFVFLGQECPPCAVDDLYTTRGGITLTVTTPGVLSNDISLSGRPLTATLESEPPFGSLDFSPDGSFTYSPAPGFVGTVIFSYHASDEGNHSNPATVTVEINPHEAFLPHISKPRLGIQGFVSLNGNPIAGVSLDLRFFNGASWSTLATTTTGADGYYAFLNAPGLGAGQKYYVRYSNTGGTPGRLWVWGTRELTSYSASSAVAIGDFDIADIALVSPANGATVSVPRTFQWTPRPATPSDVYEFDLYDPYDFDPYFYTDPPLGYVGSYTLNSLPPGFDVGELYVWEIWVYSPDGGFGISYDAREVYFSNSGFSVTTLAQPTQPKAVPDLEGRRKR